MTHRPLTSKRGVFAAVLLLLLAVFLSWSGIISDIAASERAKRNAPKDPPKTAEIVPATVVPPMAAATSTADYATASKPESVGSQAEQVDPYAMQKGFMKWRYKTAVSEVTGKKVIYSYKYDTNEVAAANSLCVGVIALKSEPCHIAMGNISTFVIRIAGGRLEPFFDTPLYDVTYNDFGMQSVAVRWYLPGGKEVVKYYDVCLTTTGDAMISDQDQALQFFAYLVKSDFFKVEVQTAQGTQTLDFMTKGFDKKFFAGR